MFRDEAGRFADERVAILEKAEALPLSGAAKAEIKEWLLSQDKVSFLDLDALLAEAAKLNVSKLTDALRRRAPKAEVYAAMAELGAVIVDVATKYLESHNVNEIGTPERDNVGTILIIAAFDRNGIRGDIASFFARPDVVDDEELRYERQETAFASLPFALCAPNPAAEAKAALLENIACGAPTPAYAQALFRAARAERLDLSPDEALAVFAKGTPLNATLSVLLEGFEDEVTPEALAIIAQSALRKYSGTDIPQMAETMRGNIIDNIQNDNFFSLPYKYLSAADEVVGKLRKKYGKTLVPENAVYPAVGDPFRLCGLLRPLVNDACAGHRILTVAEFRKAAYEDAEHNIIEKIVGREFVAIAAELGIAAPPTMLARSFLNGNPAVVRAFCTAEETEDDVQKVLDGVRETLPAALRLENELSSLVRGAPGRMAEKLSQGLDIPKEKASDFGYGANLASRLEKLKNDIQQGRHPGCRKEGFSAAKAFDRLVEECANSYIQRFAAIDALQDVSDETKNDLKAVISKENRPDKAFADVLRAQRIAAKVDGKALLAVLGNPNATDEERIQAISAFADAIDNAVEVEFAEFKGGDGLGPDDYIPIVGNVRAFVMEATPGLKAVLERLSKDPFARRAHKAFQQEEHHAHPLRATVASTLF